MKNVGNNVLLNLKKIGFKLARIEPHAICMSNILNMKIDLKKKNCVAH